METPNQRIKLLREQLNLKQDEMAEKLGITQSYLSAIEKGKREVTKKLLLLFTKNFNISSEWLLHGKGKQNTTNSNIGGRIISDFPSSLDEQIRRDRARRKILEHDKSTELAIIDTVTFIEQIALLSDSLNEQYYRLIQSFDKELLKAMKEGPLTDEKAKELISILTPIKGISKVLSANSKAIDKIITALQIQPH